MLGLFSSACVCSVSQRLLVVGESSHGDDVVKADQQTYCLEIIVLRTWLEDEGQRPFYR